MNTSVMLGKCFAPVGLFIMPTCLSDGDGETTVDQSVIADWIHPAYEASALAPPGGDSLRCYRPWSLRCFQLRSTLLKPIASEWNW